jgi:hypothetical protein
MMMQAKAEVGMGNMVESGFPVAFHFQRAIGSMTDLTNTSSVSKYKMF